MPNKNNKIFVFGDSHALFWDGTELPNTEKLYADVITYHLGPILAWNAVDKALPEILRVLNDISERSSESPDYIFLSFGEIDVRTGRPHMEECATRLFEAARVLSNEFNTGVVIVTPPPPSDEGTDDLSYPRVGELSRREFRNSRFIAAIDTYTSAPNTEKISSIHPSELLRGQTGIYSDGVHLNRKALKIVMECEDKKFRRYFNNNVS